MEVVTIVSRVGGMAPVRETISRVGGMDDD